MGGGICNEQINLFGRTFSRKSLVVAFCMLAALVPLAYSLHTAHVWEDFFITFKFSKNLCEGNGLVYEPGQRIHGFTSPLGTLVPALCYWISGCKSHISAIWLFRIFFCIPAFVCAGLILLRIMEKSGGGPVQTVFAALLFLVEAKSVMYSVNGMETAFMLLFVGTAFHFTLKGIESDWLMVGLSWAGLMWVRPDGFIFAGAVLAACLFFERKTLGRRSLWAVVKAAAVCLALYLPWFIFAWCYYGSPVPHTITAKSVLMSHYSLQEYAVNSIRKLPYGIIWVFAPVYAQFMGWPLITRVICGLMGLFPFIYWLIPVEDKLGRKASLVFFFLCCYSSVMIFPFPWYYPAMAFFGIICIVRGTYSIAGRLKVEGVEKLPAYVLSFVFLAMLTVLLMSVREMRIQQALIETGHRQKIGEFLKENMAADEKVYLECLGYVGYFSERKVLDFSGLVTPEVVRLIKEKNLNFLTLIPELKPDWIVIRKHDYDVIADTKFMKTNYSVAKEFNVLDQVMAIKFLPGRGYLLYDAWFVVLKKVEQSK